jgi:hypothetical protein
VIVGILASDGRALVSDPENTDEWIRDLRGVIGRALGSSLQNTDE